MIDWRRKETTQRHDREHFAGCLLGGAVGDALGWPVEFLSWPAIQRQYGLTGIRDLPVSGQITDDTQMTLFAAEAVLRGCCRARNRGICSFSAVAHRAYLRWLRTQGERADCSFFEEVTAESQNGWLIGVRELRHCRAPGNTCLSALPSGRMGTISAPLNDSKGCGGVMRVAPVGLFWRDPVEAFDRACECAAITHGHPSGYLSAGCLAAIVAGIISDREVSEAVTAAQAILQPKSGHEECLAALCKAVDRATCAPAQPETVEELGAGWTGEEARAIAVYCDLAAGDDFPKGCSWQLIIPVTATVPGQLLATFSAHDWAALQFRPHGWIGWNCAM